MLTRRLVLGASLALAAARSARATAFEVPIVDQLELTILADGTVSSFATPIELPGLTITAAPRAAGSYRSTLRAEWGYSVMADARLTDARHRLLIDFGYTPEALASNMALLGVDPSSFDAMVLSHGHYDHFGGMGAILGRVKRGTPLYVGGEEAFCGRLRGTTADGPGFGQIDRADIRAAGVEVRISSEPQIMAGAAFTTGRIPLASTERPKVPTSMLPGQGCERAQLDPDRRDVDVFVDDATHELGTVFNLRDKGLVIIGSCSHRGIINTVLRAQEASGIDRVHAIMGGFHLVPPQTSSQALETLALMRRLNPNYILPGHCTGEAFIGPAIAQLPGKVFRTVVGSKITLT